MTDQKNGTKYIHVSKRKEVSQWADCKREEQNAY